VPTLIKYANAIPYLENAQKKLAANAARLCSDSPKGNDWCNLVDYDCDAEDRILAASLYRFGNTDYTHAIEVVQGLTVEEKRKLAAEVMGGLDKFDIPLRELEYGNLTFDVVLDQGGYFELKRHRMMTQTPQQLSTSLGYALPRGVATAGLEQHFRNAMETAAEAYHQLATWNPAVASYVVPNAYNRRVLLQMNLRSALHLLSLRSAPNAHFSLRRLTQRMAEILRTELPLLGSYIKTEPSETWQQVEAEHFAQV